MTPKEIGDDLAAGVETEIDSDNWDEVPTKILIATVLNCSGFEELKKENERLKEVIERL